jgi:outer membrane protein assembly factor BamD (BamD/ComL family)
MEPAQCFVRGLVAALVVATATLLLTPVHAQQAPLKPEEQAAILLNGANKAFDDKQYPAAVERYKQYLATFGGQKEAAFARYGMALCFIEGPQKDYKQAIDSLNQIVGVQDFAERPFVVYYLGLAHRNWGHDSLAQAE